MPREREVGRLGFRPALLVSTFRNGQVNIVQADDFGAVPKDHGAKEPLQTIVIHRDQVSALIELLEKAAA
jgi:hypothetical protein